MTQPLVSLGDPGIKGPLVIDGIPFKFNPQAIEATPTPVSDFVELFDGGQLEVQRRPHFDGIANLNARWTISFPHDALKDDDLTNLELIFASGGNHFLTLWKLMPTVFTCRAGLKRYYLPRFRKCAAHLYSGLQLSSQGSWASALVSTNLFPTYATLAGSALTPSYANGPTLTDPGAGGIRISRQPDGPGSDARDYVPMLLGDSPAGGALLVVWMCQTFQMSMQAPRITMRRADEQHSYTFTEV